MTISGNIARYRRQKGYTQEKLGELLGVTNQAVSKWESAVSMPDIMLLPKIADVLGITLNELYGIDTQKEMPHKDKNTKIDEFAAETQNLIKKHLYQQVFADTTVLKDIVKFEHDTDHITKINTAYTLGIFPYISSGAAFISDKLSVISSDFELQNGASIFESKEIASGMKKLSDPYVRAVLNYMYTEAFKHTPHDLSSLDLFFKNTELFEKDFSLQEVSHACHLSEDDTLEALEKLISLHIVTFSNENHGRNYIFWKTQGIETAVMFHVLAHLIHESFHFGCGYVVGHKAES